MPPWYWTRADGLLVPGWWRCEPRMRRNRTEARLAVMLDWLIGGSIVLVMLTVGIYRLLVRLFKWGPRDT